MTASPRAGETFRDLTGLTRPVPAQQRQVRTAEIGYNLPRQRHGEPLMKIVQGDELDWVRGLEHRGGTFHFRNLMEGTPGTIDNFQLSMGRNDNDFVSPRHRHNFDQIRVQLDGDLDFARNGKMAAGTVGFFPEGAYYGPQTTETFSSTIVLQCGGSSGSGYLSRKEVKGGTDELRKYGTFEGGVYRRNEDAPGKRNMDGYEAIWSHVNGRAMQYPKPIHPGPVMMNRESIAWTPVAGMPGVSEQKLGVFTEHNTGARYLKLEAGASYATAGRGIHVVFGGKGRVGDQPLRPYTTLFLDHDETATLIAEETIELLHLGLPDLRALAAQPRDDVPSQAAE